MVLKAGGLRHPKSVLINGFTGLNNVLPPENTPDDKLKIAQNVDITKNKEILLRSGYVSKDSASYHSLWSNGSRLFAVRNNNLVELNKDLSILTTCLTGLDGNKISFEELDGSIYFSSPTVNGIIDYRGLRPWGIERINPSPTLSVTGGLLPAGKYQVNYTYVADDGRESGCYAARTINLFTSGGILLSNIPVSTDSRVNRVRLYCSSGDGDRLYFVRDVANGTLNASIQDTFALQMPLKMFNKYLPPKGSIIKYFNGRMFVVEGNNLWYSEPFDYEHFDLQKNFLQFESNITSIMPIEDGIWVSLEEGNLFWLRGRNPEEMTRDIKDPITVVAGTEQIVTGAYVNLNIQNLPTGYKWLAMTNKGIYAFFSSGSCINLTYKDVSFPLSTEQGASLFMEEGGINRYISLLREPQDNSNVAATDLVTTTIIRNGVVIA
jgi:hypothetical protein